MATLFRNAVINAMPQAVKNRLEDVVGLNSKTHNELCDHVSRAVEQHRNKTHKLKSQEKEIQRKLTQLQLEELTKRNKKIIKATIKKEESEQITLKSSVNAPPIAIQPSQPAAVPLNVHQIPVPIINVYTTRANGMEKTTCTKRTEKKRGTAYTGPPGMCWGCKQFRRNKIDCPTNSWQQPPQGGRGERWQQPTQGPSQGPVNHWGGPNQ